jgi:uncharacterized protein YfaQ (DUF2300 family)
MNSHNKPYSFTKTYRNLTEVLTDHRLASLGDTYVNFAYSLAQSNRNGEPTGARVKGHTLAEALKKAGLREHLPSRMARHTLADAVEALIVHAWLHNHLTLEEAVTTLEKTDDPIEGFSRLLTTIKKRVKLS